MDTVWPHLAERWSLSATPSAWLIAASVAVLVAACSLPAVWGWVRYGETIIHEMGHAVAGLVCGRRIHGIRIHHDSSGLTVSSGDGSWLGLLVSTLAGYPAPPVVGMVLVWASVSGRSGAALVSLLGVLVLALLLIRNAFGALAVAITLLLFGAVAWRGPPEVVASVVLVTGLFLTVAALRQSVELWRIHRHGAGEGSDASAAAQLTWLPAGLWVLIFAAVSVGCAGKVTLLLAAAAV